MYTIREATFEDASAIARFHVDSWHTTYVGIVPQSYIDNLSYERREQLWQRVLSEPNSRALVLVADDEQAGIVGFASGGAVRDGESEYEGEIDAIYIVQEYQRHGIGRKLFVAMVEALANVGMTSLLVWVLASNPACAFYEALGGRRVYEKRVEFGEAELLEQGYGWDDTSAIRGKDPE